VYLVTCFCVCYICTVNSAQAFHFEFISSSGVLEARNNFGIFRTVDIVNDMSANVSCPNATVSTAISVTGSLCHINLSANASGSDPISCGSGGWVLYRILVVADPGDYGDAYIDVSWNSVSAGTPGREGHVDAVMRGVGSSINMDAHDGNIDAGSTVLGPFEDGNNLYYCRGIINDHASVSTGGGFGEWAHASNTVALSIQGESMSQCDMPAGCCLFQNYPNPFNPRTTIRFELPAVTSTSLRIYDLAGRLIRTLLDNDILEPGDHEAVWSGRDWSGSEVSAGIYFCRLEAGDFVEIKRMTLVR